MPGCDGAGVAKMSYPTSEVRTSGLRGATPCPMTGAAKERGNCTSEVRGRGRKEQPHVQEAKAERRYHTF